MPMNARQTGVYLGVVLVFAALMVACMILYFGGSSMMACASDAVPSACKSASEGEAARSELSGSTPQSAFLAAATAYIMFLANNGAWAMACPNISIDVGGPTSLWPLSLSNLKSTPNIGVPACGPCLVGGRRVCTMGNEFTSGIVTYGYVTGIQTVFAFAKNAQAVLTTIADETQIVITADISNAPLWLNDTKVWWAAPIDSLACDQSLADGTWINHWARFSGNASVVTFVCGRVRLVVPVTSSPPSPTTATCSTVIDFSTSKLTFSDITVTVGQIRVAGWLIPAALLASVRAEIGQAILHQGICNIPEDSLSSFKKVTLPIVCPLCGPITPPAPPPGPDPHSQSPVSSVMLDSVLGHVLQAVANAQIYMHWPSGGITVPLDKSDKSTTPAQLVLQLQPAVKQVRFAQNGNFVVVPTAATGSSTSKGCLLQLQFSIHVVVEGMELVLVVPQRVDRMTVAMDVAVSVPLTGTSTKDKGGSITLHLASATLTCTGIAVADVSTSSAGGKVLADLLTTLVGASQDCLAQAVNVAAGLLLAFFPLPDVAVNMHADINCS